MRDQLHMPYSDKAKNKNRHKLWRQTEKGKAYVARHNRRYRAENGDKLRAYERTRYLNYRGMSRAEYLRQEYTRKLRSKYGLDRDIYDAMIIQSIGLCEICGRNPHLGLDLDHNHQTGVARGLLCRNCNSIIGKFEPYRDSVLTYLRR